MKNASTISFLSASLILALASLAVLLTPITVYAAECIAICPSSVVTCYGHTCKAQNGVGCTAWDSRGREVMRMTCGTE
jgi:hypothetical protein